MKKKLFGFALGIAMVVLTSINLNAQEGFIGEVRMFAGNFAPRGWAFCDGQLLSIAQNSALFSIVGTMYGGDGRTTFGLPDLRGRTAIGVGNGPGLSPVMQGQKTGTENVTLTNANLPGQSGSVGGIGEVGIKSQKNNADLNVLVKSNTPGAIPVTTITTGGSGGSNQPVNNMQPSLGIRYIICLTGIFPSRS